MRFSWLLVSIYCVKTLLVSGYVYDADYLIPRECDLCLASTCPQLTYCIGEVVKDHCGCCQICSSDLFPKKSGKQLPETQIETLPATVTPEIEQNKSDDPCVKRQCPKFKVCMKNVQGLPICACPSSYVCRNHGKRGKSEEVCGSDGKTYDSRCHLRIASCNAARRIKRKHDGVCTEADIAEANSINRPIEKNDFSQVDFGTNIGTEEAKYLAALNRVNKRRLRKKKKKQEKKKRRQRKKERKERLKKKGNRRQKRMKRRNEGYSMYSKRYGYLIGKKTKWGRSQIRKSRM